MENRLDDLTLFIKNIDSLPMTKTNHLGGKKRVILHKNQTQTNLTQLAKGYLNDKESVENHLHPTMEEFFFILSGKGLFKLENKSFNVSQNDIIRVPANCSHSVKATSDLEFLYWGISI